MSETTRPTPADPAAQLFAGIDLGKRKSAVHIVNARREFVRRVSVRTDAGAIFKVLSTYTPVLVGVESTNGAADLADDLADVGINCLIGDPAKMRWLSRNKHKSDRGDAESIALLLCAGQFPLIYHASREVRELRELLRLRSKLVGWRQGGRARSESDPCRHGSDSADRSGGRTGHESHLSAAELAAASAGKADAGLTVPIDELETGAVRESKHLFPMVLPRLTSIPGVGALTAAVLCAEIGDISRFPRATELLSYTQLITPCDRSGGRIVRRDKAKGGIEHLRRAFLQAAHATVQFCPLAREWFRRRYAAESQKGAGLMAVARKLATAVFHIWRDGVAYDPSRAFPTERGPGDGTDPLSDTTPPVLARMGSKSEDRVMRPTRPASHAGCPRRTPTERPHGLRHPCGE